jgi:hypothetical protein
MTIIKKNVGTKAIGWKGVMAGAALGINAGPLTAILRRGWSARLNSYRRGGTTNVALANLWVVSLVLREKKQMDGLPTSLILATGKNSNRFSSTLYFAVMLYIYKA